MKLINQLISKLNLILLNSNIFFFELKSTDKDKSIYLLNNTKFIHSSNNDIGLVCSLSTHHFSD